MQQKAGRITAAWMDIEVSFEPANGALNDQIDEAYQKKYRDSPYLKAMVSTKAKSATVRIVPLDRMY
jgi:hypothetical protein